MKTSKLPLFVSIVLHSLLLLALAWAVQSYFVKGNAGHILNAYVLRAPAPEKHSTLATPTAASSKNSMQKAVIPTEVGIQNKEKKALDPRLRGDDESVTTETTVAAPNASQIEQLLQIIANDIQQNLHYPHLAQTHILQGQSVLQFDLDPEGEVQNIQLVQSSGVAILDEAAQQAIRESSPINIPSGIQIPEAITLRLPVTFRIQD